MKTTACWQWVEVFIIKKKNPTLHLFNELIPKVRILSSLLCLWRYFCRTDKNGIPFVLCISLLSNTVMIALYKVTVEYPLLLCHFWIATFILFLPKIRTKIKIVSEDIWDIIMGNNYAAKEDFPTPDLVRNNKLLVFGFS